MKYGRRDQVALYDVRAAVAEEKTPISQQTGEDHQDVSLVLSATSPQQNNTIPRLLWSIHQETADVPVSDSRIVWRTDQYCLSGTRGWNGWGSKREHRCEGVEVEAERDTSQGIIEEISGFDAGSLR